MGPYYICLANKNFTYKLRKCADNTLLRSLVHANRLMPYRDPDERPTNPPSNLVSDDTDLNPEEIPDPPTTAPDTQQNVEDPPRDAANSDNTTNHTVQEAPQPSTSRLDTDRSGGQKVSDSQDRKSVV